MEGNGGRWGARPRITLKCSARPSDGRVTFLPSMLASLEPGSYDVVAFYVAAVEDALGVRHELEAELPSQGSGVVVE